jgi:hypothetical protein
MYELADTGQREQSVRSAVVCTSEHAAARTGFSMHRVSAREHGQSHVQAARSAGSNLHMHIPVISVLSSGAGAPVCICIVARTGLCCTLVLHRVSATLLVRLLEASEQYQHAEAVRHVRALNGCSCQLQAPADRVCADHCRCTQGLWKHTARSAVRRAFWRNSTTLYCYYHAPGPSVHRYGCLACVLLISRVCAAPAAAGTWFVQCRHPCQEPR